MDDRSAQERLARAVTDRLSVLPQVEAVALAGSFATGSTDAGSDIDLYIYVSAEIPAPARGRVIRSFGDRIDLDNHFWGLSDEFIDRETGSSVDMMYWSPDWMEDQLDRVLRRHEASTGYTTAFWHNVRSSQTLFDRVGWHERLREMADQPYPEPLRAAILRKNYPILREKMSSYAHQIEKAVTRQDTVSLNHRVAALLASYFDILFAVNRLPHPGEKRLLMHVEQRCEHIPKNFRADVEGLLTSAARPTPTVMKRIDTLVNHLDALLRAQGFDPATLA